MSMVYQGNYAGFSGLTSSDFLFYQYRCFDTAPSAGWLNIMNILTSEFILIPSYYYV
eukprot:UN19549